MKFKLFAARGMRILNNPTRLVESSAGSIPKTMGIGIVWESMV